MEQSFMKNQNNSRTYSFDQYKKDWAYAARALQKGQSPEKVIGAMAAFRKDLTDSQQYAEKTVAKVQDYLKLQQELGADLPAMELTKEIKDSLDNSLKHISKVEVGRRLYEDGADRDSVTKSLQQDHRLGKKEAVTIAKDAETRFFSERDLNYAIRARERGDSDDRIIPKIAEYREGKVENPQAYARSIVEAADIVRDAERDVSIAPMTQQGMDAVQQQYGRDLHHAVLQLEHRSHTDVTLEIHERHPEKAYDSPSFRLQGQPDPSYAVAVVHQAQKVREMTDQGRSLEDTLDVAAREFRRQVSDAVSARERGESRSQIIEKMCEGAPGQEFYARTVVNHAESIREHRRELSVRPEMARAAVEYAMTRPGATPERTAASAMER